MNTLSIPARPALQRFYRVAGRFLLVAADDIWSAEAFSRFFDGWYFSPSDAGDGLNPDAVIRINRRQPLPQLPPDLQSYELPGDGYCHSDGTAFYIEFGSSLIALTGDCSSEVEVWLGAESEGDSTVLASVVSFAVSSALRRCGVYELHSGGVSEPDSGKGALIIGASGSGKSTLTLQLASVGWGYLSDDVLLLHEVKGLVEAWGLRRDFAVTEETLAASGIQQLKVGVGGPHQAFDSDKRRLPPGELFPTGHVAQCAPSTIFFPVITGEPESRVELLSQAEAMSRLIRMCPWASFDECSAGGHLRLLAQLVRQCRSFEVFAGRDLLNDPTLAARLIRERV